MLIKLSLRNIFRNRRRSLMTLFVLVFAATALIMFGGYKEISFHGVRESMIRNGLGHLQVYKRGYLETEAQRPLEYGLENYEELRRVIEKNPKVEMTAAQISLMGMVTNGDKTETFLATAVEPSKDQKMASQILKAGEFLSDREQDGVIVGELLARSLNVKPGDYLTLMTTSVNRSLNGMDVKVLGTFSTGVKDYDERSIKMPLIAAQRLMHTSKIDKLLILLKETKETQSVEGELARAFASHQWDVEMRDWSQLATFYHQVVALYNGIFGFLGAVVFVIVILSVSNTVMMSILERTREIGTLLAIGTTRYRVWTMFLLEGLMIGILGGGLGLAMGSGLAFLINHSHIMLPPPPGYTMGYLLRIMLTPSVLTTALLLSVITSTLSAVLPAVRASRLNIVRALGHI